LVKGCFVRGGGVGVGVGAWGGIFICIFMFLNLNGVSIAGVICGDHVVVGVGVGWVGSVSGNARSLGLVGIDSVAVSIEKLRVIGVGVDWVLASGNRGVIEHGRECGVRIGGRCSRS